MAILDETGMDPRRLELEITESVLIENAASVRAMFDRFRKAGITISIDDFGTGYCSLSYLKRFPVDRIKIDRSFVRDCLTDADAASLVRAMISMAHSLNLSVVAEGVESREQLDFLRAESCEVAQGYFIGRPAGAEQMIGLLLETEGSVVNY